MSVTLRFKILEALHADASGNIAKAKANIEVYLENPVGIGEHPEERDKTVWVSIGTECCPPIGVQS